MEKSNSEQSKSTSTDSLSFEQCLKRLEEIVLTMESGDVPLDHLLKLHEEGTHLAQVCSAKLNSATQRIETITKSASGQFELQSFEPGSPIPPADTSKKSKNTQQDVSLF